MRVDKGNARFSIISLQCARVCVLLDVFFDDIIYWRLVASAGWCVEKGWVASVRDLRNIGVLATPYGMIVFPLKVVLSRLRK